MLELGPDPDVVADDASGLLRLNKSKLVRPRQLVSTLTCFVCLSSVGFNLQSAFASGRRGQKKLPAPSQVQVARDDDGASLQVCIVCLAS